MVNEDRRKILKFFSTSFLTLSVSPYIIGVNQETLANSNTSFNKHNLFNPRSIGWEDTGPLKESDLRGIFIPESLSCRIIARSGEKVTNNYTWHGSPDGASVFPSSDGGWIYVSNSELGNSQGGAGAIKFNKNGEIQDAYSILKNSSRNCSGGATPWETWLSCEEHDKGIVWETSPASEWSNDLQGDFTSADPGQGLLVLHGLRQSDSFDPRDRSSHRWFG